MKIFQSGAQIDVPGQTKYDFVGSTHVFVGESLPGTGDDDPGWVIKKVSFDGSGNPTSTQWATEGAATCQWSQRAGYTYS